MTTVPAMPASTPRGRAERREGPLAMCKGLSSLAAERDHG
jgi:hypothetical protein